MVKPTGLFGRRTIALVVGAIALFVAQAILRSEPKIGGANQVSPPGAPVDVDATTAGPMPAWAKIYPGATLTVHPTIRVLGVTAWQVSYTVKASPDQIRAFYKDLATEEGFTETNVIGDQHFFTQDSTDNKFSYLTVRDTEGTDVEFDARTFKK